MQVAIIHNNEDSIRLFSYLITELGYSVTWSTQTQAQALQLCKTQTPDLILVQVELTDCKADKLIRSIMNDTPTTVIAISSSISQNSAAVFDAMSAGALDAFSEPSTEHPESIHDLKNKINNIKKLHDNLRKSTRPKRATPTESTPLVAIGSSTGGPAALLTILKSLPRNPAAIFVIIQHMDNEFSEGMARWLDEQTEISVEIARTGQTPKVGHVYMACTDNHLSIDPSGYFNYIDEPVDYPYRPSVDVFFESAVAHWPNKLIGVLLTGMGRDGANGLLSFYNRGMLTIAQSQESCAVYGMPKAACELNAVTVELDISDIAKKIIDSLI